MKGEKELIENILQTEINIFLSIRDGSALMQHMEDFYYITLLEVCIVYLNNIYFIYVTPCRSSAILFQWDAMIAPIIADDILCLSSSSDPLF